MKRIALVVVLALSLTACASVTEQTGLTPDQQVGAAGSLIQQALAIFAPAS